MGFFRELLQGAQKKATRAAAIWMRTAFSDLPTNFVILSVCFTAGRTIRSASDACGDRRSPAQARRDRWPEGAGSRRSGPDHDLAHRILHRVLAVHGLPGGQKADPVAEHGRSALKWHFARLVQRRIGLEARHQTAAERVEFAKEAEVVIAEIEHIGRARFDRHRLRGADVIDVGGGHGVIDRAPVVGIVDDMRLGPEDRGRERADPAADPASLRPGRVDQSRRRPSCGGTRGLRPPALPRTGRKRP